MAKLKLYRSSIKNSVGTVNVRINRAKRQEVEHITLDHVEKLAGRSLRDAIRDVTSIYSDKSRLPSPVKQRIKPEGANVKGNITTNYAAYSSRHSDLIRSRGKKPTTKPYWHLDGNLSSWVKGNIAYKKPHKQNVSFRDIGSIAIKGSTLDARSLGRENTVPVFQLSGEISFPYFANAMMRQLVMQNFLNGVEGAANLKQFFASFPKPSPSANRENMAIYAEETVRPLIAPLMRHHGEQVMRRIRQELDDLYVKKTFGFIKRKL